MGCPVVMYGCESWTVKKAEHQRIDAFWRRLLRVPWTARRSNQSILKISPECSLEGLMLKLKLQYLATQFNQLPPQKISIIMPIRIKWHCKQFLKNYNAVNEKSQIPQSQLYDHL